MTDTIPRLRVAVILGGPSPEAEVSRISGQCVGAALESAGYRVELIELSQYLTQDLASFAPDVVAPILHGTPGEDGSVQALLDLLGYAYLGSSQAASTIAMHKSLTKSVARRAGLSLARDILVVRREGATDSHLLSPATTQADTLPVTGDKDVRDASMAILTALGTSLALKPDDQGSALGVRLLRETDEQQLQASLQEALNLHERVLIEPLIQGAELTVGVLDVHGEAAVAFPVTEIRTPENTWYDFHHRYTHGKSEHLTPAPIPASVAAALQAQAVELHQQLGCRDLSRVDFMCTPEGELFLLELNSIPGMTPTSLYPDGARAIGIEFEALMHRLIVSAHSRGPTIDWPPAHKPRTAGESAAAPDK